ncbi:MAG TPA: hypothetical protein VF070_11070 [Streptosporangiaceae bacterium]
MIPYAAAIAQGIALIVLAVLAVLVFFWARRGSQRRVIVTVGCVATGIVLLGAFIVSRVQGQASSRAVKLTRLGLPLELPSVPGYFPMGGYALPDGSLEIDMGRDGKTARAADEASVLSVSFYRVGNSEGATVLHMCAQDAETHIKRQFTCQAKSAGLWRVTAPGMPYDEALARRQNMIVVAHEEADAQVPDSALLRAVSSLRPATAAQIAALPSTNVG